MNDIRRLALPQSPDGSLRDGPGPKIFLVYTPTIGYISSIETWCIQRNFRICVLKQFLIPRPLSSLTSIKEDEPNYSNKLVDREIKYTSAVSFQFCDFDKLV